MIELPDFNSAFDFENKYYLSCSPQRISKFIAHYELFKKILTVPGEIVECGVFKGASLARFAMFRELLGTDFSKKIIAFDSFNKFPETNYQEDKAPRESFVQSAGEMSISVKQMLQVLANKGCGNNVELIEGDICKTVPQYVAENPHLKISLLNLDTDIYEPSLTIIEQLFPRIMKGGVLILDDYGIFPGVTKIVDDYFQNKSMKIFKFPFCSSPAYIIKE